MRVYTSEQTEAIKRVAGVPDDGSRFLALHKDAKGYVVQIQAPYLGRLYRYRLTAEEAAAYETLLFEIEAG